MVIGAILLLIALIVLFFPFVFRVQFRADLGGAKASVYLFKKKIFDFNKKFKDRADKSFDGDDRADPQDDKDFAPTFVPPVKKAVVKKEDQPKAEASEVGKVAATSTAPSWNVEKLGALKAIEEKPAPGNGTVPAAENVAEPAQHKEKPAPRKKLTDVEFWTILLTPEFDASAFWAVKKLLSALLGLFQVKFQDCFVEGIRADYTAMGYGAALNGIMKSFPFVGAWDIRMDWTRDHELCAQGQIRASINLCRILGLLFASLFLGGFIAFKFWRRRSHVLKTGELPELGWIRKKIVNMMAEE